MKNRKTNLYFLLRLAHSVSGYLDLVCYYFFLDIIIIKKQSQFLLLLCGLYVLCYLVETLLCVLEKRQYNRIFPELVMQMKEQLMTKYTNMDLDQLREYRPSDLKSRIHEDTINLAQYDAKKIEVKVLIVNVAVVLVVLFYLNLYLALFCLVMLPVSLIITKHISMRSNTAYADLRKEQIKSDSFLDFVIRNWKEIRLNRVEDQICEEYVKISGKIGKLYVKTHLFWFVNRTFIAFKDTFVTKMSIYFIGGILIIRGHSEVSVLLVFMQFYERLINVMMSFGDLKVNMGKEKESINKIQSILDVEESPKTALPYSTIRELEIRNGSFSYDHQQVLKDVNLTIKRGRRIGIAGKSGCGKSTILKLLLGILKLQKGEVLVDGVRLEQVAADALYESLGIIMQDSYLFNLSIRENLLFGKETATEEEMTDACRKVNILDYILGLENGFDSVIGENGVRLSGGQRQRIIIARMLLHDPEMMCWDEATSALDGQNKSEMIADLMRRETEKTYIVVAHDLETIQVCEYIFFMEEGRIVDEGTHQELMERNENYRNLWGVNGLIDAFFLKKHL